MNYYPFHVGDYAVDARYLTLMQDLAYRRLIDLYYTREMPLPLDAADAARKIGMGEFQSDVETVLRDYFQKSEDGYRHKRCDEEIAAYRAKADRAKSANNRRWSDKKYEPVLKSDLKSDADQIPTNNQEPITNNQEPVNKKTKAPDGVLPDDIDPQVAADFIALSAKQRATITPTRLAGIEREAAKAGLSLEAALRICCERSWRGFKADWVLPQKAPPPYQTAADKRQSFAEALTGRNRERTADNIIDLN